MKRLLLVALLMLIAALGCGVEGSTHEEEAAGAPTLAPSTQLITPSSQSSVGAEGAYGTSVEEFIKLMVIPERPTETPGKPHRLNEPYYIAVWNGHEFEAAEVRLQTGVRNEHNGVEYVAKGGGRARLAAEAEAASEEASS